MPNEDQSSDNHGFPITPYSTTLHCWGSLKIHFSIQIINHSKHLSHPKKKNYRVLSGFEFRGRAPRIFLKIMNLDNSKILT